MLIQKNIHIIPLLAVLLALFVTSCTDDAQPTPTESDEVPLVLVVNEEPWENEEVRVTRSNESMLNGIKGDPRGFGLYCSDFNMTNQQVTWGGTKWDYGSTLLWSIKKSQEIDLYAYAPHWTPTYSKGDHTIIYDHSFGEDLMWASQEGVTRTDVNTGVITLDFKHALGKLSFGSLTNNYGRAITLTNVKVTGTPYKTGKLSLVDGSWSDLNGNGSYASSQNIINRDVNSPSGLAIAKDATATSIGDMNCLLIPGSTVTITLTFTSTDFGEETVSFNTTLPTTTNTNTTLNITLTNNFEVVIE